jgi:hypothetical protein
MVMEIEQVKTNDQISDFLTETSQTASEMVLSTSELFYSLFAKNNDSQLTKGYNVQSSPKSTPPKTQIELVKFKRRLSSTNFNALSAIYTTANGASWTANTNWLNGEPCPYNWDGLVCSGSEVTEFVKSNMNMAGTLASQIGLLTSLVNIQLSSNDLSGSLPSQIGLLSKMTSTFELFSNRFIGSLPSQIGQLTLLTKILLYSNQFCDDIPSEVSVLSSQITSGFKITTGNSLGTICCVAYSPFICPTSTPTSLPTTLRATPTPTPLPITLPTVQPSILPTYTPIPAPTFTPTVTCLSGTVYNGAECIDCGVGYYSNFSSPPYPRNCTLCPPGQYNTASGQPLCITCDTGKLSSDDRSFCKDCEAGEYSYNDLECVKCPLGQYAPQALADSCLTCDPGLHTNNATKATTCTSCDAGKYSEVSSTECLECASGSYSLSGQKECIECETGKYSSISGSSSCTSCTASRTSWLGSTSCLWAADGYYLSSTVLLTASSEACPSHATCFGADTSPIPHKGYWVDHSDYKYASTLYKCPRDTCDGANSSGIPTSSSCWNIYNYNKTECQDGEIQCSKGAEGHLCGACSKGYVYKSVVNSCQPCEETTQSMYIILGVVCFAGCIFAVYFYSGDRCKMKSRSSFQFFSHIDSGSLKVLWVTYQIITSSSFALDVQVMIFICI